MKLATIICAGLLSIASITAADAQAGRDQMRQNLQRNEAARKALFDKRLADQREHKLKQRRDKLESCGSGMQRDNCSR